MDIYNNIIIIIIIIIISMTNTMCDVYNDVRIYLVLTYTNAHAIA